MVDKPIMGLKSDKNYITANAVDVILMQPKRKIIEPMNYLDKKSYGKIPAYLSELKMKVESEYKTIREMQLKNEEEEAALKRQLEGAEVLTLREGLVKKLEELKKCHGETSHKKVFDTLVSKRRYDYF
jgi:hypothetical protein